MQYIAFMRLTLSIIATSLHTNKGLVASQHTTEIRSEHMNVNRSTAAHVGALLVLSSAWVASSATAQTFTPPPYYTGSVYGGSSTLTLSSDTLAGLDTMRASASSYGYGTTTVAKDTDGYYTQVSMAAPTVSVDMDVATMGVYATHAVGGLTLTAPSIKSFSSGGTLTITDLSLDFGTKLISGTVIGANGVGTLTNVGLWTADSISSSIQGCPGVGLCDAVGHPNIEFLLSATATGLRLTDQGQAALLQSLGIQPLAHLAMENSLDFGTLNTQTYLLANDSLHAVPEPATWALMGLGLVGLFGAARRSA